LKASDLFVKTLENQGVQYIFGLPGEENLDLLESIRKSSIKFIVTRHEQAAGFMAATYGRLTGTAGVCLSTLGPGATNLMTAVAFAQLGGMPLVIITGQKPVIASKQAAFQIIDVVDMMRPITKMAKTLINAAEIPYDINEAFRCAEREKPGAVHLELPEDIARQDVLKTMMVENRHQIRPISPTEAIEKAAEVIRDAKHPLIMVGAGANRQKVRVALLRLVDQLKVPFFCTQMGKGVIDERHSLYLGTAALSENDYVHCAIDHADLVINVGHDIVEKPPFFMKPGGKKVIHINYTPAIFDELYFPQYEIVGDIAVSLSGLAEIIGAVSVCDLTYYQPLKQKMDQHITSRSDEEQFPLLPQFIIKQVRRALPDDGVVSLDNGMYKIWFARNYPCYEPNTILLDNALATMGAGLASAMAAKLVFPNRKVVAVCGDGGFMMNSQELETAIRMKIDIVVIVLVDDALGMIRWKQQEMGFPEYALSYNNPDFQKYGVQGIRITEAHEFYPVLQKCLDSSGVFLIEVPIDYRENHRVFNEELSRLECK